ncbi:RNA exonuclease 4 [Anabrus simplex]|uniref:RNA exonuclease 4 n=1 Tax=Anabrus simplex TaxID=316456 RepID=UPI0035A372A4
MGKAHKRRKVSHVSKDIQSLESRKEDTGVLGKPRILEPTPSANWKLFLASKGPTEPKKSYRHRSNFVHKATSNSPYKSSSELSEPNTKRLTKIIGMDCEMVGVEDQKKNMLARVSIVNRFGECVYDKYVKPTEPVKDYRTWVSGIRPHNLENGEDFLNVKQEVSDILRGRIVVGHALKNDFSALGIKHPKRSIRDTAKYSTFRKMFNMKAPSLRKLAKVLLGVSIQEGEHSSVQDAKAALQLYMAYRNEWEKSLVSQQPKQ